MHRENSLPPKRKQRPGKTYDVTSAPHACYSVSICNRYAYLLAAENLILHA